MNGGLVCMVIGDGRQTAGGGSVASAAPLCPSGDITVKICDFGLSVALGEDGTLSERQACLSPICQRLDGSFWRCPLISHHTENSQHGWVRSLGRGCILLD